MDSAEVLRLQAAVGFGLEDTQMIIEGMAQTAAEPTYCMGDDVPLPVLAASPHMLYDYFKQKFAQVGGRYGRACGEGCVCMCVCESALGCTGC
jgi:glutamate synthase (ferredoxin)